MAGAFLAVGGVVLVLCSEADPALQTHLAAGCEACQASAHDHHRLFDHRLHLRPRPAGGSHDAHALQDAEHQARACRRIHLPH